MPVPIADLPRHERPRERLWREGADALSDAELLALVLRSGRRGESALELASSLLADFGLAGLAASRPEELAARPGVGAAKACSVLAAFRLAFRLDRRDAPEAVRGAADLAAVARREFTGLRHERVVVMILDAGHRLRRTVRLSEGGADRAFFPVRETLNAVLRNDGRAFAVAHNHPSGDPAPSPLDVQATRDLAAAARLVGLRFLDHLVVTDAAWTSLRQGGHLD